MSDQAQAVEPSIDARLDSAIMAELNPQPDPEPQNEPVEASNEPVEGEAPAEAQEPAADAPEAPEEPVDETPPSWDELREVKIKVPLKNGDVETEQELALDELRLGYMRTADYQRKTQEVATQRAEIQNQFTQAVQAEQAKYVQQLQAQDAFLQQLAAPELQNVDWNRLSMEDPAQFVALYHKTNQLQQARQQIAQQIQDAENQRIYAQQQQLAQAIPQAQERLKAKIPNWSPELQATLRDTGMKDYGFSAEEIGSVLDPRQVEVLHDAMQWRQLQKQKPITEKKVVSLPKVLKPGAKPNAQVNKVNDLLARVKRTQGKDHAALEDLIKQSIR